jgi:hypothetical protein
MLDLWEFTLKKLLNVYGYLSLMKCSCTENTEENILRVLLAFHWGNHKRWNTAYWFNNFKWATHTHTHARAHSHAHTCTLTKEKSESHFVLQILSFACPSVRLTEILKYSWQKQPCISDLSTENESSCL